MASESNAPQGDAVSLRVQHTQVRLFQEDCITGMPRRLEPGSVDVVVTSPPYNIGVQYGAHDDNMAPDEYLAWTGRWVASVAGVLGDNGSFFLNVGSRPKEPWVAFDVAQVVRAQGFKLQNTLHWVKSIAIMKEDVGNYPTITGDVVVGHFKPINSRCYVNDVHEYVFHFTKTGRVEIDRLAVGVPYQDKTNIARWNVGRDVHCRGNTWFIPYKTIQYRERERPHPATFPPKLAEMCIRLHGVAKCRRVLDPFMGLGSTAVGAVEAGVPEAVGFEIDEAYLEWAAKRLLGESERAVLVQRKMEFGE